VRRSWKLESLVPRGAKKLQELVWFKLKSDKWSKKINICVDQQSIA
jgi:hypothetical protein